MSNHLFAPILFAFFFGLGYLFSDNFNLKRINSSRRKEIELFFERDFDEVREKIQELCKTKYYRLLQSNPNTIIFVDHITLTDMGHYYKVTKKDDDIFITIMPRVFYDLFSFTRMNNKIETIRSLLR